ncbi:hypothetical protein ACWDYK_28420 [Streptomyces anthocyanicus]
MLDLGAVLVGRHVARGLLNALRSILRALKQERLILHVPTTGLKAPAGTTTASSGAPAQPAAAAAMAPPTAAPPNREPVSPHMAVRAVVLPAPFGAHDAVEHSVRNAQAEPVDGEPGAEALSQVRHFDAGTQG